MSKVFLTKMGVSLYASDPMAEEAIAKIKIGEVIAVEFTRPRNVRFHRWWWGLMSIVATNMPGDYAPEVVCEVIKIRIGHVDVVKTRQGEAFIPRSISFAKLDESGFKEFVDRAIRVIVDDILPGVDSDVLRREVDQMLGSNPSPRPGGSPATEQE